MVTQSDAINIIKQYIALCNANHIQIKKAILFGSYANGTATEYSDIDLLLVSDIFTNDSLKNWNMLAPITAKLFDVQPHPYPTKNFNEGDPFLQEILINSLEIN